MDKVFYHGIPMNGFEVKIENERLTFVGSRCPETIFFFFRVAVLRYASWKCTTMRVARAARLFVLCGPIPALYFGVSLQ